MMPSRGGKPQAGKSAGTLTAQLARTRRAASESADWTACQPPLAGVTAVCSQPPVPAGRARALSQAPMAPSAQPALYEGPHGTHPCGVSPYDGLGVAGHLAGCVPADGCCRRRLAGWPHSIFRATRRGWHHPIFRLRKLTSERLSHLSKATQVRKWQSPGLSPGSIGPQTRVVSSTFYKANKFYSKEKNVRSWGGRGPISQALGQRSVRRR